MSDFLQREKSAEQKASRSIRNKLNQQIKSNFTQRSRRKAKKGVRSRV